MSHHSMEPRGTRDFSSPQIRVRGANDYRQYSNQRLRLPNERPPMGRRLKRILGALLTLAIVGGIGIGVYFGVTLLIEAGEDPATAVVAETAETIEDAEQQSVATQAESAEQTSAVDTNGLERSSDDPVAAPDHSENEQTVVAETEGVSDADTELQVEQSQLSAIPVSAIEPTVSEQPIMPAQLNGAEIVAERVTAEPIPSGIPRVLADGVDYDPTEPATVFTSRWPVGTSLRLTRLPGATLLSAEQQEEVVGTAALVVVRGTESSNTDLQLSPAAFDQIAFYGTERIIAVRVEVTAPPP